LKIGPHVPKLLTNIKWYTFCETHYSITGKFFCSVLFNFPIFGDLFRLAYARLKGDCLFRRHSSSVKAYIFRYFV